jgi:RNA polymerase sigma-70 factor (ECF subfamily)
VLEIFLDSEKEKCLVERSSKDPKAFGELFEEHYDSILRYCIYHTAQVEIARDITAETFYKALKNIWRYRFTGAPFSAWLYRIAGNEVIDYFRRKKYSHKSLTEAMEQEELVAFEHRTNLQEEIEVLQQKLEENRAYQKIRCAMEKMPIHYRDVLILRFVEEKKISEICKILGKKEGTVKSLISRGITSLREFSQKNTHTQQDSTFFTNDAFLKENL